jgi:hypothetical protein
MFTISVFSMGTVILIALLFWCLGFASAAILMIETRVDKAWANGYQTAMNDYIAWEKTP